MTDTSHDTIKAAWNAILAGDYAERDRLVEKAKLQIPMEDKAYRVAKILSVDFYVDNTGKTYPSKAMFAASN